MPTDEYAGSKAREDAGISAHPQERLVCLRSLKLVLCELSRPHLQTLREGTMLCHTKPKFPGGGAQWHCRQGRGQADSHVQAWG